MFCSVQGQMLVQSGKCLRRQQTKEAGLGRIHGEKFALLREFCKRSYFQMLAENGDFGETGNFLIKNLQILFRNSSAACHFQLWMQVGLKSSVVFHSSLP